MVVRVSGGVFLEILESTPSTGVPIEVDVYDGGDLATMIATLEGAADVGWTDPFGDIGSGSLRLAVADPKATATIVRSGNLVKLKLGGIYRFAYWIENPKATVATIAGVAGKFWTLAGRGKEAYLERAQVYPAGYPLSTSAERVFVNATFGEILKTFVDEAQGRGAIPALTYDFDDVVDSQGNPWLQLVSLTIAARTSLLDVWRQLIALGMEGHVTTELRLQAFVEYARHKEDEVIFREGRHLRGEVGKELQDAAMRTRVLVEGAGGKFVEVSDPALEDIDRIGRREGGVEFSSSADPTTLQIVGESSLRILSSESEAIDVPVFHGEDDGDFDPYVDYRNGDWVRLDVPTFYDLAVYRVRSISVKAIPGDYEVDLDLNSVAVEDLVTLKRMIDALGGGSSGSATGGSTGVITGPGNSGGSGGSGKVSAEFGDQAGYLYDKIATVGLGKALGGSPGARSLVLSAGGIDGLTDVDTSTIAPTNGQALVFDAGTGLWKPAAVGAGAGWSERLAQRGSGAHALDDEFDDAAIAPAWIRVDRAGNAANVVYTEAASVLSILHTAVDNVSEMHAFLKPLAGATFPLTISLGCRWFTPYAYSYFMIGPCLTDGTVYGAGKQMWLMPFTHNAIATAVQLSMRSYANFSGEVAPTVTAANYQIVGSVGMHLRLRWTAADTFYADASPDGVSWVNFAGPMAYTLAPTHVGFAISSWAQPSGAAARIATVDYFRVS